MASRDARRVLLLAVIAFLASVLLFAWIRHAGRPPTPEEQAREKAAELQERARALTR
jgi:hypothetical protein